MGKDKILSFVVNWHHEKYRFEHGFNIESMADCFYKIYKDGNQLKHPDYIYKFYNDSLNSLDALLNGYLYFPKPSQLNDPFECLNNREQHIFASASDSDKIKDHRKNIGICSFSLSHENTVMWGHYTKNYNGFCLKFDNRTFLATKNMHFKGHVPYLEKYEPANKGLRDAMNQVDASVFPESFKKSVKNQLFSFYEYCWKDQNWAYENEYRFMSLFAETFNRKLKFDRRSLREVYIDFRMKERNPSFYNLLLHIVKTKYPKVKVFELKPNPLIVKFDFVQIKY